MEPKTAELNAAYRMSTRHGEILDVLQKAKSSRSNFCWRSHQRQLVPISINRILPESDLVEASSYSYGAAPLKVGDELYLKLDIRDSAFKTKIKAILGGNITLEFPDEVLFAENRREARQYFLPSDEKVLELKRMEKDLSPYSGHAHSFSVSDISPQGVALILSPKQSTSFQVNDRISLESLGGERVFPSIVGKVVFKNSHSLGSKIGIRLESKISKVLFEDFAVRKNLFSITEENITHDVTFRRKVHHRMDVILRSLKARQPFKDIFSILNPKNPEQYYLLQHIYLLAEVMCGLGTRLGWVTEVAMDKLIYVAYLHDAAYFKSLHLTKIPSKREFDRVINSLSKGERELFLDGPGIAADLAYQDPESFPDAIKILLQQKEFPDGSGFPSGLAGSQFIPLSCLFVLSHYFVDYVLTYHDWSVADFVKTHEKKLIGPHFKKIFQVLK